MSDSINAITSRIGFWQVLSVVIGSQIGSGMFMLPTILAPYGIYSLAGWSISGGAAICLAITFAFLCSYIPKTGGPHAYVEYAFGPHAAFFIGWAYWLVSWISTVVVIITSVAYLNPFLGDKSKGSYLALELVLLLVITLLNLRGVQSASKVEIFLSILKYVPLVILPFIALFSFNSDNFVASTKISSLSTTKILSLTAMLTMWGFIGVETGTTPAGTVVNPSKTIPKALIFGTICVTLFYILNSIGVMGLISPKTLALSKAPYTDVTQHIFGGNWHIVVSLMVSLVCIGTINAWTLVSGQIILGLAEDNLVPKFFKKKNTYKSPYWGILVSSIGIACILLLTCNKNLGSQISTIIDYSVTIFLFVYLVCGLAAVKILWQKNIKIKLLQCLCIIISIAFCSWVIWETSIKSLLISSIFVLSGLPIYLFWYLKNKN